MNPITNSQFMNVKSFYCFIFYHAVDKFVAFAFLTIVNTTSFHIPTMIFLGNLILGKVFLS